MKTKTLRLIFTGHRTSKAQIEEEQKLIEASKKLVEIYEQKIKERIADVWGVEK